MGRLAVQFILCLLVIAGVAFFVQPNSDNAPRPEAAEPFCFTPPKWVESELTKGVRYGKTLRFTRLQTTVSGSHYFVAGEYRGRGGRAQAVWTLTLDKDFSFVAAVDEEAQKMTIFPASKNTGYGFTKTYPGVSAAAACL